MLVLTGMVIQWVNSIQNKQNEMAKIKFTGTFIPRDPTKKRPGVHTKSQNKNAKRQKKQTRYKGQGR